eukprot:6461458-Amphidinium_carterae.1
MALCSRSEVAVAGERPGHLGGAVATTWCAVHSPCRAFPRFLMPDLALEEEEVVGQSVSQEPPLFFCRHMALCSHLARSRLRILCGEALWSCSRQWRQQKPRLADVPLVLSPLGNVRKEREGRVKNRVITDLRQANRLAQRSERVVLPRRLDHAHALSRGLRSHLGCFAFILDLADAYLSVPREAFFLCSGFRWCGGLALLGLWRARVPSGVLQSRQSACTLIPSKY